MLRNASDGALGYKAMTNAPRRWSVRPNGGVIEAGASVRVVATYVGDVGGVAAAGGFGDDRHLILSVPLLPHQAEKLTALRRDGLDVTTAPDAAGEGAAPTEPTAVEPTTAETEAGTEAGTEATEAAPAE